MPKMTVDERQPLLSNLQQNGSEQYLDSGTHEHSTSDAIDHLLINTLCPADAYKGGLYWADLNGSEKRSFASKQYRLEALQEWHQVRAMFKHDYISPFRSYVQNYVAAGAGFFAEGNVLFSVGNTMPLLKALWPDCWARHLVCDAQMIDAIKYMEILGVS